MKKSRVVLGVLFLITILLNVLAWNSKVFCDNYVRYIFPAWINTYGRITGLVSFSTGEVMIAIGMVLLLLAAILALIAVIFSIISRKKETENFWMKWCKKSARGIVSILIILFFVMTCNCFILYHCSTFEEKYDIKNRKYSLEELAQLRDYIVVRANTLAKEVKRDENGNVMYKGDMKQVAMSDMKLLGEQNGYDQLMGFYPRPKGIMASGFLSQQYMQGYYFPFSMEANYNDVMYVVNKPATMCHELAHLKGFIYEDEANFISYLACVNSKDPVFEYSGYLSVLSYVDKAFYQGIHQNKKIYHSRVRISALAKRDNVFLQKETWKKVEKKAVIKTKTIERVTTKALDVNLNLNGIEDGTLQYSRVVELLLKHYDGVLY